MMCSGMIQQMTQCYGQERRMPVGCTNQSRSKVAGLLYPNVACRRLRLEKRSLLSNMLFRAACRVTMALEATLL